MTEPSRRAVLTACGAGVAALAGCSQFDAAVGGKDREFDEDRLIAIGEIGLPTPPDAFPVSAPDAMIERHRTRARELVNRVPESPDVPNGVVVERLRRERDRVLGDLSEDTSEAVDPLDEPFERLVEERRTRRAAAAVEASYRAATGDVSRDAIADRREQIRQDSLAFEADWTYRGDDPATAVAVHRALEGTARTVSRGLEPEHAFPSDSTSDVSAVGQIVGGIEAARAALTDADRLRSRYLDGLAAPEPHRDGIAVAVRRLEGRFRSRDRGRAASLDLEDPPFDRSIDGTPADRLYVEAARRVRGRHDDIRAARRRGDRAEAFFEAGDALASVEALEAILAAIEDGRLGEPSDAEELATVREAAVEALEAAWTASPTVLAVELTRPASYLLRRGSGDLAGHGFDEDHDPDPRDADRAYVSFYLAARFAEAVPATVDLVAGILDDVAG